ncbi:caspase family protein [Roseomonas sp. BN140053]|uniref:caspase family protein n=1 Tax=Roseomonas sp. BN140053 TaxID=3391898 RepID=UPI0039E7371C
MRLLLAACLLLLSALTAAPAWAQGRRVALVMGINSYQSVQPLQRARNDAVSVGQSLEALGFEVILSTDADRRGVNEAMSRFEERLRGAEVGLFFFAGHGVEIRGTNVLLAADTPATLSESVVLREGLLLTEVSQLMSDAGVRFSVLVIDACRDNPLPRQAGRSVGRSRGLGLISAPRGTYVVYSAGIGEAALDSLSAADPNPNSVFTRNLLPVLSERGISFDSAVKQVRERVRTEAAAVHHQQNPAIYDQATGELFLAPAAPEPGPAAAASAPGGTADASGFELVFWQSIQNTSRPAELEAYLARWPNGVFAPLARSRLAAAASPAGPLPGTPLPAGTGPATPPTAGPSPAVPPATAPGWTTAPALPPTAPPPVAQNPATQPAPEAAASPSPPVAAGAASGPAIPDADAVLAAQRALERLGLDPGLADGEAGPRTQAAIRAFQVAAGLPPDGDASPALLARLRDGPQPPAAELSRALLAAGNAAREARDLPEAVRLLEAALRLAPNNGPALLALGDARRDAGSPTQARNAWSRARRLEPDGPLGRAAAERLAALAAPRPAAGRPEAAVTAPRAPAAVPAARGTCGVSFTGSRSEPGLAGFSFNNSCDVEMVYRAQCAGNRNVASGDLTLRPRSSTTLWVAAGRGAPGSCTVVSTRPRS